MEKALTSPDQDCYYFYCIAFLLFFLLFFSDCDALILFCNPFKRDTYVRSALITGGAGFIGSHLAERLVAQGVHVTVLDDYSTGAEENIAHLKGNPLFCSIADTVTNRSCVTQLVAKADMVFHLAAAVGVRLIVDQPVHTIKTNLVTTETILELCAEKEKPVLITSSSEVYGKLDKEAFREDDDLVLGPTCRSRWCYAASKILDEFFAQAYFKEAGLRVVTARLFNTIGPRQTGRYGMVVPSFIKQALSHSPLTVYGDGSQRRSFTWVEDVVEAMIALIRHAGAYGGVFNIGHYKDISIYELALMVKHLTGTKADIIFVPYERAYEAGFEDMRRRLPDISKIRNLINYHPSCNLPKMLQQIITYYRQTVSLHGSFS
jgi:UDP-glucose 4-epimerase